jgi:hypothetical protein
MRNQKKSLASQKPLRQRLVFRVFLVVVICVVGLVIGYLVTREQQPPAVAVDATPPAVKEIILYFASEDARTLVAEMATINDCIENEACLRDTVNALIAGPEGDLVGVLPSQTTLLNVTIEDSLITLDFSKELVTAHPGGTQSELLSVYALADTLTANFPYLRQLRILVEGEPVDTIKGHVDLRRPIYPDFSFVEEGVAPLGEIDQAAGRDE